MSTNYSSWINRRVIFHHSVDFMCLSIHLLYWHFVWICMLAMWCYRTCEQRPLWPCYKALMTLYGKIECSRLKSKMIHRILIFRNSLNFCVLCYLFLFVYYFCGFVQIPPSLGRKEKVFPYCSALTDIINNAQK